MAAFLEGVSYPYYLMNLVKETPRIMTDMREERDKQIRAEELLGGRKFSALSRLVPLWKNKNDEVCPSNKKKKKKKKIKTETTLNPRKGLNNTHL